MALQNGKWYSASDVIILGQRDLNALRFVLSASHIRGTHPVVQYIENPRRNNVYFAFFPWQK